MESSTLTGASAPGDAAGIPSETLSARRPHPGGGLELAPGDVVAGRYRIGRILGEGGMGRVYLARDPVLARRIALKVVRPERLDRRALERLGEEARTTAKFNHANIVTIYDAGTHEGFPFLALEYVEGESLAARFREGPLSIDEALRLGHALADALAYAHAHRVMHCDLKPANVLIPRDGRYRILDFGLAVVVEPGTAVPWAGTPSHMAPEQWRREPLSPAVDVWALGVILYEAISSRLPFSAEDHSALRVAVLDASCPIPRLDRPDLPADVTELIARALDRTPEARPTAKEIADHLAHAIASPLGREPDASPFRGLLPFEEEHAHFFIGRRREVDGILERLREEPMLAILGPSGVGKSSLVRAGVVPRLRARGAWSVITLRPSGDPFRALAAALLHAGGSVPDATAVTRMSDDLAREPGLTQVKLQQLSSERRSKMLLFVDQLEELFSQVADVAVRARFLDAIFATADDPCDPVRLIFTLRDDFIGRLPGLERVFVVGPMDAARLRAAITEPVERAGCTFDDPALVGEMVAEIDGRLGNLPLLQFACAALWDARDPLRKRLLRGAYDASGGVSGMLSTHADRILEGLDADQLRAARRLLLALVSVERTRLLLPLSRVLAELGSDAERMVERLLATRLLVLRRAREDGEPSLELAHESLIVRWARLRAWIDGSDGDRIAEERLRRAAGLWLERGARPEDAPRGDEIAEARRLGARLDGGLPAGVERYLRAGEQEIARRKRRRLLGLSLGFAALALVTLASLLLARDFRRRQLESEAQADALRLAGANMGRFRLSLAPFDWDPRELVSVPVAASALPSLDWTLHRVSPEDPRAMGPPLPPEQIRRHEVERGATLVTDVEAPGMPVFLEIRGRGRAGEQCSPAWLQIASLPGYTERNQRMAEIRVPVATCRATQAGMIAVPAGPWIDVVDGGGAPSPTRNTREPDRISTLPGFALDETEVANAQYRTFADLASLTGIEPPRYPTEGLLAESGAPDHPVTSVNAYAAEAFCRFLGKRLPTTAEWTKAARGGLTLDAEATKPNPDPRRPYPWGSGPIAGRVNIDRERRERKATLPVGSLPEGRGPYGHLHLVGNVREWMAQSEESAPLRPIRGGGWSSPIEVGEHNVAFENVREPRYFDFSLGFRCAAGS